MTAANLGNKVGRSCFTRKIRGLLQRCLAEARVPERADLAGAACR